MNGKQMKAQEKAAEILALKGQRRLTMLTAYDYPSGRIVDEAGVDMVLVGDSLGMVVLGYPDTTHVTLSEMVHHTAAVARGRQRALLIADLPIHTYDTPQQALASAQQLVAVGADAVKLEGGLVQKEKIRHLVDHGIPVVAHIGLLPQSILLEGGYKIKGKTDTEAQALHADLAAVIEAGAFCVVIEGTKTDVALSLTAASRIPTIGIGSGKHSCDGAVAVLSDLCGAYPWFVPAFIKPKVDVAGDMDSAARAWIAEILDDLPSK